MHRLSLPDRPLLLPRRGLLGRLVLLRRRALWRLRVRLLQRVLLDRLVLLHRRSL